MEEESAHYDELKRRGYELFTDAPNNEFVRESGGSVPPVFGFGDGAYSIAIDERGSFWMAAAHVDLADLGFERNETRLNELCDSLGYRF